MEACNNFNCNCLPYWLVKCLCPFSVCFNHFYTRRHHRRRASPNTLSSSNKVIIRRINSNGHYCTTNQAQEDSNNLGNPDSDGGITNASFQDDDQVIYNNQASNSQEEDENNVVIRKSSIANISISSTSTSTVATTTTTTRKETYKQCSNSIYLNTGPAKCIHVIHIKTNPSTKLKSHVVKNSMQCTNSNAAPIIVEEEPNQEVMPNLDVVGNILEETHHESLEETDDEEEEEEDEDEYWFSKWSKRPKLKCNNTKIPPSPPPLQPPPPSTPTTTNSHQPLPPKEIHQEDVEDDDEGEIFDESPIVEKLSLQPHQHDRRRSSCSSVVLIPPLDEAVTSNENISPEQVHIDLDLGEQLGAGGGGFINLGFQEHTTTSEETTEENSSSSKAALSVPDIVESVFHQHHHKTESTNESELNSETINHNKESLTTAITNQKYNNHNKVSNNHTNNGTTSSSSALRNSTNKSQTTPSAAPSPILFFIHGISASSTIWTHQLEYFHTHGYELILIDLIGHGLSSTPNKSKYYTFESLLQDLVYIYDYFIPPSSSSSSSNNSELGQGQGQQRQVVVVGHGYGGCLASVLSRVRPHHISLLILLSSGGPTPLAPPGTLRPPSIIPFQIPNIFEKKRKVGRFDPIDLLHILPKNIHQHIIDGQIWLDCDTSFHHRIASPTLLVYGLRDSTVSLIEECEMEKAIPKAYLELIPSAGHFIMIDEPKKLNRMMLKFIQSWLQ